MIVKARANLSRLLMLSLRNCRGGEKGGQGGGEAGAGEKAAEEGLVETKGNVQLMQDTYQRVQMQGLQQRDITGVDSFQREILSSNKFDLQDPRIQPKVASMSTTMGLDLSEGGGLAEVNLGSIKVKRQDEVFLSEVDPGSIPEYHNVVFDLSKQMSLVGRRVEGSQSGAGGEMSISGRRAFEERSLGEMGREVMGVGWEEMMANSKVMWKVLTMAAVLAFVVYQPVISTLAEVDQCLQSIQEIEEERMKQLGKMKREAMVGAIVSNANLHINNTL